MKQFLITAMLGLLAASATAQTPAPEDAAAPMRLTLTISRSGNVIAIPLVLLFDGDRQTVQVPDGASMITLEPEISVGSSSVSLDLIVTSGQQVSRPVASIPLGGSRTLSAGDLTIVATVRAPSPSAS